MRFVTIVPPPPGNPTVAELKAYKDEHGCSLGEACRALGWKSTRVVPYTGAIRIVDGEVAL